LLAETAISRNPQLRQAEAIWRASQLDTEEVRGARWPRLDVLGTSKAKQFGPSDPYGNGVEGRVGVTLTYTLFDGGKVDKQISSKLYQEQAERDKYLQTREQTIFDTASAYLEILKYRKLVDIYQLNSIRLAGLVSKMDEIVQVIGGRRSELTQSISRLLQAKENRAGAEAKLREFEVQLLKLIGTENMSKTLEGKKPQIDPLTVEAALAAAKKSHPVLLAANAEQLAMKDSASAIRKSNYWPVFEVQASKMSGSDMLGYNDPGRVFATLKWNAFQGFSGVSQEKATLARADAAQDKYDQSLVDIEYKLNSAWKNYQNQHDRVESLRILSLNTEQVRNDYYAQWETLGKRSLLEVLTAENEHVSALTNLATSEFDEQLALVRLRFESGTLAAWLLGDVK
jgi:adhesin transport system outer membrane protein